MIQKTNSGLGGSHRKERKGREIEARSAPDVVISTRGRNLSSQVVQAI
jgi:hypothetical protein